MDKNSKIYLAGHRGLAGSAILRDLERQGYTNILTRTHEELDLRDQVATRDFFETNRPEYVLLAAAKVGGIHANNTYPADFIYDNLAIQNNAIHASYTTGVKRLLFLGSSCIYPKLAPQPLKEESMLTGLLEETNAPYAIAKIAGLSMCSSYNRQYGTRFFGVMPTNLYGPNDNFNLETSHVLPALIRKFHEAKEAGQSEVVVWGTGTPLRELLYVDDMASACTFLMQQPDDVIDAHLMQPSEPVFVNVGTGEDRSVEDIARTVASIIGFEGEIVFDRSKPDGTPRKLLDVSRLAAMGWSSAVSLEEGIERTYRWYRAQ